MAENARAVADDGIGELAERLRRVAKSVKHTEISDRFGIPARTLYRYLQPGYVPTKRPDPATEAAIREAVEALEAESGHDVPRGTSAPNAWPWIDEASPEGQLVTMLGIPDALRRMAGHVPASDLVAAAMQLAVDEGWPEDRRERLAQLAFEVLQRAKDNR